MNQTGVYKLSKGPDKKERTNREEHVEMQKLRCLLNKKCAIFSTTLLIGLTSIFKKIFTKQHVY